MTIWFFGNYSRSTLRELSDTKINNGYQMFTKKPCNMSNT